MSERFLKEETLLGRSRSPELTPDARRELALRAIHGAFLGNKLAGGHAWRLTRATNRALVRMASGYQAFAHHVLAEELIRALNESHQGWGPTTIAGVCGLKRFRLTEGKRGSSGEKPVPITRRAPGRGNGAALRVTPLVFAGQMLNWVSGGTTSCEARRLVSLCFRSAWMTHGHPVAWVGALLLTHALHQEFTERRNGFALTIPPASLPDRVRMFRTYWQFEAEQFLRQSNLITWIGSMREAFDQVLKPLERLAKAKLEDLTIEQITQVTGTESASDQSVPLALVLYLRHANDPEVALREAASVGGDTGGIAAMTGLLVGVRNGPNRFPVSMPGYEEGGPKNEAEALVDACLPRPVTAKTLFAEEV